MASRKRQARTRTKSRERARRTASQWLIRLKGGEGKAALHLPPDFVLWVFAGLLAHLDRQGDAHVADLAEGALSHGGGLSVHDGTRWQSAGPAHDAALRAIAQAFADLDLTRGRRQDRGAWEMLDKVEVAYTSLCVGLRRRQLSARATKRQIRARGDEIQRQLQRAGLLKLVGGSVPFVSA